MNFTDCRTVLQTAYECIQRGIQPLPISAGSKAVSIRDWPNLKIKKDEIPKYFQNGQNIGVCLGEASGNLIDVDIDSSEALLLAPSLLLETKMVHGRKSKPDSHWWYQAEPLPKSKRFQDIDGSCLVELRSTGGQTLIPPSTHPSTEEYIWSQGDMPAKVDGHELEMTVRRLAAAALLKRHYPQTGSRQDFALALSGVLLRTACWPVDEARNFIELVSKSAGDEEVEKRATAVVYTEERLANNNAATGVPKLAAIIGDDLVHRLMDFLRIREGATVNDRRWENPIPFEIPLPAFPMGSLPGWLSESALGVATETQTPKDMSGMLGLTIIAAAVAKKCVVQIGDNYREPLNIYTVTVLASGTRKTPVVKAMLKPIEDFEKLEIERMKPIRAEAIARRRIAEKELQAIEIVAAELGNEKKGGRVEEALEKARGVDSFLIPPEPKLLVEDISPESLARNLCDQNGRIALISDEADIFDIMNGRYSKNGAPNIGVFLKSHCGSTLRIDRISRPSECVYNPALTLGLTTQPIVIDGLRINAIFRGRGLMARILFSFPENPLGRRNESPPPVPARVATAYHRYVSYLLNISLPIDQRGILEEQNFPAPLIEAKKKTPPASERKKSKIFENILK